MTDRETLTLNGFELNDDTNFVIEGFTFTPAGKKPQFASNADADGEILVGEMHYGNATFEFDIRTAIYESADQGREKLHELVEVLQEADRIEGGIPLEWTPTKSETVFTFYVLVAEINGLPVTPNGDDAGWFMNAPVAKVKFTCRPFGYKEPIVVKAATESAAEPMQILFAKCGGDVPAEAQLVFSDKASKARRLVEWGQETVLTEAGLPDLLLTAAELTTTGFAGEAAERTGAFSEKKVKRLKLTAGWLAFVGTGAIKHVGRYRLKARVFTTEGEGNVKIQASYQSGNGNWVTLPSQEIYALEEWIEVDLGEVTFEQASSEEQRSEIRILGKTIGTVGKYLELNYLTLVPCAISHGLARGPVNPLIMPSVFIARDEFDQVEGALNGKALPDGSGNWTTEKSAKGDFTVNGKGKCVRTAKEDSEPRFAKPPYAEQELVAGQVTFEVDSLSATPGGSPLTCGLNWASEAYGLRLIFGLSSESETGIAFLSLMGKRSLTIAAQTNTKYTLTLLVKGEYFSAGWLTAAGQFPGGLPDLICGYAPGTKGRIRIQDKYEGKSAITRTYDNYMSWVPELRPVCNSGRSVEFNWENVESQDASGTYRGSVPFYRGGHFYLIPEGETGLINRLMVRGRRNDIYVEEPDAYVEDKHSVELLARERVLAPLK